MPVNEFDLIQHFFNQEPSNRKDVILGIGDDAALLRVPLGQQLVVTTDTLVSGRHFPENTSPADIGYKALAVSLSDLAAMGADPAWILLALTLPNANEIWLRKFSEGFFPLMQRFQLQLVGGDMTQGPLTITVQALGFVPPGKALCRIGARAGDRIYVTGTLGDAGLALETINREDSLGLTSSQTLAVMQRLNRPEPRVEIGLALRKIASSAIDVSDGLAADLGHILSSNQVGAILQLEKLPLSDSLRTLPPERAWQLALSSGDDYELCFTVPESQERALQQHLAALNTPYTCIGTIKKEPGSVLLGKNGSTFNIDRTGFQHFI
ncbi:thiamine-phosphate kinase [Rickettsiella endosymbiont of Miltochrista miniata]|uniref:thiamine-phosphate kinase n=1 Tax=Rickettsiella endosymbiont of Miltochrista miniata TaxID=3066239 RepID=UPI00313E837F